MAEAIGMGNLQSVDYAGETKRDRFQRLAEKRTNTVLAKIRTLANCSNPYAYEYAEEDIKQIFTAIEEELRIARAQFRRQSSRGKFELKEW